jgi:hypothetical protein
MRKSILSSAINHPDSFGQKNIRLPGSEKFKYSNAHELIGRTGADFQEKNKRGVSR